MYMYCVLYRIKQFSLPKNVSSYKATLLA
uniref:Uncharacterized protein n=1 Tax=Arundo donax TaxID=35708 RepID=A0A0A9CP05_ARUDO